MRVGLSSSAGADVAVLSGGSQGYTEVGLNETTNQIDVLGGIGDNGGEVHISGSNGGGVLISGGNGDGPNANGGFIAVQGGNPGGSVNIRGGDTFSGGDGGGIVSIDAGSSSNSFNNLLSLH